MITVLPEGGLCNRMRVVASTYLLASAAKQPMRVLWYRTPDFNARFDTIFSTADLPFAIEERSAMSKVERSVFFLREAAARCLGARTLGRRETLPGTFSLEKELGQMKNRDVFVRTNSRLAFEPGMFDLFTPSGAAATAIDGLRERVSNCVGVHVRRTDNINARKESTLERFVELMTQEMKSDSKTLFFLATDEPEVTQELKRAFSGRVWEYPKHAYARNDPAAIVDAVVDLYALGLCRKLIGSYWSSFTDTASELRGIECVVARAKDA